MWNRKYENSKFQWLPTYFKISEDGDCHISDYVNNLDKDKFQSLYKDLERLFEVFLPYFEEVCGDHKEIHKIPLEGGTFL